MENIIWTNNIPRRPGPWQKYFRSNDFQLVAIGRSTVGVFILYRYLSHKTGVMGSTRNKSVSGDIGIGLDYWRQGKKIASTAEPRTWSRLEKVLPRYCWPPSVFSRIDYAECPLSVRLERLAQRESSADLLVAA